MREAYHIASTAAQKEASRGKHYYDQKTHGVQLHPGNRVLLRNFKEKRGPGKLRSYWEDGVYVVVAQKSPDMPVYEIRPEQGCKSRTVRRNLLLPCDSLPVEKQDNKQLNKQKKKTQTRERTLQENSDTDSEEEGTLIWRSPRLQVHEHTHHLNHPATAAEEDGPQAAEGEAGQEQPSDLPSNQEQPSNRPSNQEQPSDLPSDADTLQQRDRDSNAEPGLTSSSHVYPRRERRPL